QKPTPVGTSGYVGTAAAASASPMVAAAASSGKGLFSQKRGNEAISALLENGVTVPMDGSLAAQRQSRSSQCGPTIASEFSSTTSARDRPKPRFAVPVKPRLRS